MHQVLSPSQGNTESRNVSCIILGRKGELSTHFYQMLLFCFVKFLICPAVQAPQEEQG